MDETRPDMMPAPASPSRNRLAAAVAWFLEPQRRMSVGLLTTLVLAAGFAWRLLRYGLGFPLWGDESFVAVSFITRDYAGMIKPLEYGQIVSLGYMWATLAVTQLLGYSEWALHLIACLSGLIALTLFWQFARRNLTPTACLLALGFFATAFYVVRHTAEVKPYASDLMFSIMMTALAWRMIQHPRSRATAIGLILLGGIGVWCSYPFVFIAGGAAIALAVKLVQTRFKPTSLLVTTALFCFVLAGSFLAMYVIYAKPHADYASRLVEIELWGQTWPPLSQPWLLPVWFVRIHLGYLFAFPQGGKAPYSIVTFTCFVAGAIHIWRTRRLLAVLLTSPFLLNILAACFHAYPYGGVQRIAQHLAPAICLLAGQGLLVMLRMVFKSHGHVRFVAAVFAIFSVLFGAAGMITDLVHPYSTPDSKRSHEAVRELADASGHADTWVIFNAREQVQHAPWLGDWRGVGGVFVFDVMRFAPGTLQWSPPPDEVSFPPGGGDLWLLIYWVEHPKVPEFPQDQLDSYLSTMAERLGQPEDPLRFQVKGSGEKQEIIYAYRFRKP